MNGISDWDQSPAQLIAELQELRRFVRSPGRSAPHASWHPQPQSRYRRMKIEFATSYIWPIFP